MEIRSGARIPTAVGAAALALTLAVPALSLQAQSPDPVPRGDVGRGFFQAGLASLDLDELNGALVEAGYPSLDDTFVTLGGAGYGTRGRLLLGGEGHGILETSQTTADGGRRLGLAGGYGLFRVGWLAWSRRGLDLFPLLGIGGGGMTLSVAERSAPTFDDVLDDPERSSTLSSGSFLLDLAVAVNYRFGPHRQRARRDEGEGGFLLGLQAGYLAAPGDTSWELDGINDVAGGPDLGIEGFYIRISLGGWGAEAGDRDREEGDRR